MARAMKDNFPKKPPRGNGSGSRGSDRDENRLYFANTVADLSSGLGCSTVVVEKERSKTGAPALRPQLRLAADESIAEHTLIVVYKGEGKRAFAAITVTPIEGVISGMNDAGLSLTINEISLKKSKDKAAFNWNGTRCCCLSAACSKSAPRWPRPRSCCAACSATTSCCLTLCDKDGGAVFEITPKNWKVRPPENGVCCCTNHYRTEKLMVEKQVLAHSTSSRRSTRRARETRP